MAAEETGSALHSLAGALGEPLDRNDLGRLARMHTYCQTLTAAQEMDCAAGQLSQQLVLALEKVILDEAQHPDECLRLIPDAVALLRQAIDEPETNVTPLLNEMTRCICGADAANCAQREETPASELEAPAPAAQPGDMETAGPVGGDAYVSEPLILNEDEREHLQGFAEESREHMDAIEAVLLAVEQDPSDRARIDELFRPFHTIKGIAGFLNLRDINRLAHEVETVLDLGRKGSLTITSSTIDLILAAVDLLKLQIQCLRQHLTNPEGEICPQPNIAGVIAELRAVQRRMPAAESGPGRPRIGELLITQDAATPDEVATALGQQAAGEERPLGEILVGQGAVSRKQVDRALTEQTTGSSGAVDTTIRIETTKLDSLIDAVGELVIAQTMVGQSDTVNGSGDDKLLRDVAQVTKIVRDVQEMAMGLRMVPIGATFQKMRRVVRDVARKQDKQVELHVSGEETELDKTVTQQISDPLVHMVRNAVDHGIEPAAQRRAAGKPEVGSVWLDAYHQGDSIVIEVRDDGAGLDPKKLIAKGIARGLIDPEDTLTDAQAFALVLQPGFSMAAQVTDISGRGVGMDVVKRNIEQLHGKLEIHSELGRGTTFTIRLPLTLAIIDGMLVRVGRERLIVPTILIEQSLRPLPQHIHSVQQRGEMLQVRDELCPLLQVGMLCGYDEYIDPCEALVVVALCENQKIGLVVQELIGQQQVVVKSLTGQLKQAKGVSGAAILGDGRVGLILEPTGLLTLHNESHNGAARPQRARRASEAPAEPTATEPSFEPRAGEGAEPVPALC